MSENNRYHQVGSILDDAIKDITKILTAQEDELHLMRMTSTLKRERDQLLLLTGNGDAISSETVQLGPAKTIGGKEIKKLRKFTEDDLVPSDDKLHELKQGVESAIEYFRVESRTPESLIAQIPDIVIRGVAKKVGFTVTKENPAVLTPEFVGEVQAKVKELYSVEKQTDPKDGETDTEVDKNDTNSGKNVTSPLAGEDGLAPVVNMDAGLAAAEKEEQKARLKAEIEVSQARYTDLKQKVAGARSKERIKELSALVKNEEDYYQALLTELDELSK